MGGALAPGSELGRIDGGTDDRRAAQDVGARGRLIEQRHLRLARRLDGLAHGAANLRAVKQPVHDLVDLLEHPLVAARLDRLIVDVGDEPLGGHADDRAHRDHQQRRSVLRLRIAGRPDDEDRQQVERRHRTQHEVQGAARSAVQRGLKDGDEREAPAPEGEPPDALRSKPTAKRNTSAAGRTASQPRRRPVIPRSISASATSARTLARAYCHQLIEEPTSTAIQARHAAPVNGASSRPFVL